MPHLLLQKCNNKLPQRRRVPPAHASTRGGCSGCNGCLQRSFRRCRVTALRLRHSPAFLALSRVMNSGSRRWSGSRALSVVVTPAGESAPWGRCRRGLQAALRTGSARLRIARLRASGLPCDHLRALGVYYNKSLVFLCSVENTAQPGQHAQGLSIYLKTRRSRFDFRSGHLPRLQAPPPVWGLQETASS